MSEDKLFIVRGTGFPMDGSVVFVESVGDDGFCSVVPYNSPTSNSPIKIHNGYLQSIDMTEEFTYSFAIVKFDSKANVVDSEKFEVKHTLKNVNASALAEFVSNTVSPLLKME
jgi:hypothetical protein